MLVVNKAEKIIEVDNYVLEAYRTCEEKYRLMIRDHWTPDAQFPALAFGIAMHEARATYKKAFLKPAGAVAYKLTQDRSKELEKALAAGLASWDTEMPDDMKTEVKVDDKRSKMNFERLFRGYIAKYGDPEEFKPIRVESPGKRFLGITPDGWTMNYVYTIDEVVEHQGKVYPVEFKTDSGLYPPGVRFFEKFGNMASVTGYLWAIEQEMGIRCEGSIIHSMWVHTEPKVQSKSKYTLPDYFKMDYTYRDDDQIEEWKANTLLTGDDIVRSVLQDRWKKSQGLACHVYNGCSMRRACLATPAIREKVLEVEFKQRLWNPWARLAD